MSIKLDWEIEAEQEQIRGAGEDPDARRRRAQLRFRFLLTLMIVFLLIGGAAAAVWLRLRQADWLIEQRLRDTVAAEVAALRVGSRTAFLDIQRSASDDWIRRQADEFDRYQNLKLTQDLNLTGRIVDLTVDRLRGRVVVEEIVGGVPYGRVWFYWNYVDTNPDPLVNDGGWRHLPPDYTFWGEMRTLEGDYVTVHYRELDMPTAEAVHAALNTWVSFGCAALRCPRPPDLAVTIEPDPALQMGWSAVDESVLRIRSPFVIAMRLDQPFDAALRLEAARLVAERLVAHAQPITPLYPTDAVYIRTAIVNWLMGRFAQIDTGSYLIDSIARTYGDQTVGVLLQTLTPDASIALVAAAVGAATLDQLNVDWRDFLTWRLRVEAELIAQRNRAAVEALYDTRDEFGRALAEARFAAGAPAEARSVVSVLKVTDALGIPTLRALVQVGESGREEEIPFRLYEGVWRRAG